MFPLFWPFSSYWVSARNICILHVCATESCVYVFLELCLQLIYSVFSFNSVHINKDLNIMILNQYTYFNIM